MSFLSNTYEYLCYTFDNMKAQTPKVHVNRFYLHGNEIFVSYRMGSCYFSDSKSLNAFEDEFFGLLSFYDKNRVTKFSTLQSVLTTLFEYKYCDKDLFMSHIEKEMNNEQLF